MDPAADFPPVKLGKDDAGFPAVENPNQGRWQARTSRFILPVAVAGIVLLLISNMILLYSYRRDIRMPSDTPAAHAPSDTGSAEFHDAIAPSGFPSHVASLLQTDVLELMVDTWLPWDRRAPIHFGDAIHAVFPGNKTHRRVVYPKAWPALMALSGLGLNNVPDMMTFLPDPEAPEFPRRALGLQLLLDQASRYLFHGIDRRWAFAYFDRITARYVEQLDALPAHLDPRAWARWGHEVSVDYWLWVRFYWGAALVHNEAWMEKALAFTAETRTFVQDRFQTEHSSCPGSKGPDSLYRFPEMLAGAKPSGPGVAEGLFWLACLLDAHSPLLEQFGRYPFRNGDTGRRPTAEEDEWCCRAGWQGICLPPWADRVLQDVEARQWTALRADEASWSPLPA